MPFNPEDPTRITKILGESRFISASQILDYEKCPFYFLMARVYKEKPEEEHDWGADTGKEVHDWHEGFFDVSLSFEKLEEYYENFPIYRQIDWYKKNLIAAELRYMHEKERKIMIPIFTEYEFEIDHLVGRIDRLELRPDGNLTVVEVKPSVQRKYPKNQRWQLTFYSMQINKILSKGGIPGIPTGAKVTHGRIVGYKDASQDEFKINGRTINTINKRIPIIRNAEVFPMKYGQPLCKYCEYETQHCLETSLKEEER
jgi:hypothetical protein